MPTMWLSDSQKIGVAFCSGGMSAGILNAVSNGQCTLPPPPSLPPTKPLTLTIHLSARTDTLSHRAHNNNRPLQNAPLLRAPPETKRHRCLFRRPHFDIDEMGAGGVHDRVVWDIYTFGDFLGTIAGFARNLPVVGGPIGMLVDRLGVARSGAELPV
ncbi:hypothetical protein LSUB1_G006033 [Lachnellula subtilissima]|uniref:Uncharacterized protein n=1 Tax=Lachnellula subtilissima TaxID=602034 RepID=A0A8H8RG71_9HELO|nr:hypothetical protein LSUB1_G006033 [Lachnellula subtilissima]